jgi:hypothetical protein
MKRSFGAYLLALFGILAFIPALITSCANPSSPSASGTSAATYSASAFFNTEPLGDTSTAPFPFCFPAQYIQQKLGLTDSQIIEIQAIQDSLRTALQAQLAALKAAGKVNPDTVRDLRLEYQTSLYEDIAAILTPAQLTELQGLTPPQLPPNQFHRIQPPPPPPDSNRVGDTTRPAPPNPAVLDSLALIQLENVLAIAGDTLTAAQITQIQNLEATLNADTTLTPQGRMAEFQTQIQTILTADQIAALKSLAEADRRRPPMPRHR